MNAELSIQSISVRIRSSNSIWWPAAGEIHVKGTSYFTKQSVYLFVQLGELKYFTCQIHKQLYTNGHMWWQQSVTDRLHMIFTFELW